MKKTLFLLLSILLITGCKDVKLESGENAIVTFKEGGISAQELYETLKETYGAEKLTDLIDSHLLNELYEETDEEKNYVKQSLSSAKAAAKEMNADFDLYVNYYYGVANEEAFKNYIALNYKRSLWIEDYGQESVTDKQIKEYYEDYIVGDMTVSHIQINSNATSDMSEEDKEKEENKAYEEAKDIIEKLKKGEDFSALAKKYSDDEATSSNGGSLGKINDDNGITEIVDAAKKLKVGSYSTSPVKTSYGYHIIYKSAEDKKPELNDETKTKIRAVVGKEISSEPSFYLIAMKALREKNEMKITDSKLEKAYNDNIARNEAAYNAN